MSNGVPSKAELRDFFKVVKWGCNCANTFFRIIYSGKMWLPRREAENAIYNGWNVVEPWHFHIDQFKFWNLSMFRQVSQKWTSHAVVLDVLLLVRQEAYGCCSAMSAAKGWALYYIRPKIHMFCHIVFLSCLLGMISPFLVFVLSYTALAKPA